MGSDDPTTDSTAQTAGFSTTSWNLVLSAGDGSSPAASQALERLCRIYAYPLYVYVRRQGHSPEDAQDLTQSFFASLLARNDLAKVRPDKGRFRSFLLASINHFLSNERKHALRDKRGGGVVFVTLEEAEARYGDEMATDLTAERLYEQRWALTVIEQTLSRLRAEHGAAGKQALFDALKGFLTGEEEPRPYGELGRELGLSEDAVKMAVYRLRARYRELLRAEIEQTVAAPEDVDDELRHLVTVLS